MKKLTTLLFAGAMLVSFSSVAMAQSSDNETISANATVVQGMVVGDDTNNIEFNNILIGSGKFINAADGSVDAAAASTSGSVNGITGGEERGWFDISIVAGTDFDFTLAVPSTLSDGNGNSLPFSVGNSPDFLNNSLNGVLTETKPSGSTSVSNFPFFRLFWDFSDGIWTLDTLVDVTMPDSGKVYLALGGFTLAASDQALGTYSGTIILTATVIN